MDPVRFDLDFLGAQHAHSHVDEPYGALVNRTTEAQHHSFGKLAGAYPVDAANLSVDEHV